MKAILLAGGTGSRLFPVTRAVNKHLLNIYDRSMIHYPIETLRGLGATQILLITNADSLPSFKKLLGTGAEYRLSIDYAIQEKPGGIAEGILIAETWLAGSPFLLALGDNLFLSPQSPAVSLEMASVWLKEIEGDVRAFGVFNPNTGKIDEKPQSPASDLVAVGLYSFPGDAPKIARATKPSARGELEITSVLNRYAEVGRLSFVPVAGTWFDCGSFESLLEASNAKARIREYICPECNPLKAFAVIHSSDRLKTHCSFCGGAIKLVER